ncbi:hypothetical protein MKW94_018361 [Papaver nudicaule]|uniref:Thylakoid lumenal 17.9 kDa protein, chloroplastic n=1 Tax=Papaver nudicaule TaxID=74823 RepID=A0AA41VER8_PAPNU|nr:hypothetical protein [Papaver nudicaule]
MRNLLLLSPQFPQIPKHSSGCWSSNQTQNSESKNNLLLSNLASVAVIVSTALAPLPSLAIPSLKSQSNSTVVTPSPSTPFSQSKNMKIGLENGKIRPCPSINPSCISTNPKSSSFAFPWVISKNAVENAVQKLQEAITETQKNAKFLVIEDTPDGKYVQAEIENGGFGNKDVVEFLVKGDVVAYRCMAEKVTYVYPFTTAFGDSKGQEERMKKILDQLGWYAPSFESMD